jgi:hypothetical protein
MRTGQAALASQLKANPSAFSGLHVAARALLLLAIGCGALSSPCLGSTNADAEVTFALNVSHAMRDRLEDQAWRKAPDYKEHAFAFDIVIAYETAVRTRYKVSGEEWLALEKIVRARAKELNTDVAGYFRMALTTLPLEPGPHLDFASKGFWDFWKHFDNHKQEAERLARDLSRAIEGDEVDLKGRLGAQERDIEIDATLGSVLGFHMRAYDSATRHIYSIDWAGRLVEWLKVRLGIHHATPELTYVKDASARDDFARLLYQCWDRYISKPDEYVLRKRLGALRYLIAAAGLPHPTATDEAMRLKLGVEPEKWKAFQQFIKDVRAGPGLWEERINPPKER